MTAMDQRDVQTVRMLLRKHLPSAFLDAPDALTFSSVACHLHIRVQFYDLPMLKSDYAVNERLEHDRTTLPADLDTLSVEMLGGTAWYRDDFLEAAREMLQARGGR